MLSTEVALFFRRHVRNETLKPLYLFEKFCDRFIVVVKLPTVSLRNVSHCALLRIGGGCPYENEAKRR